LEIGAAGLLLTWAVVVFLDSEAQIRWSPLNWPVLGFLGIGLAQLMFHGTAYSFYTGAELLKMVSYFIVFFLSAQAFRERADLKMLSWFLIFFCFAVSLFGIVLHFAADGEIFGFSNTAVGGSPFGPFVNRNHFAGFVELILPISLALLVFRGFRRDFFPLATVLTIVPLGALILSGSRGGIVSFAFEVGVLVLLARSQKGPEQPRFAAVAAVGLAALALIAWLGAGKAIERFSTIRPGEVSLSRRATMVRSGMQVFLSHPILGTGLGTLVVVYPRYETGYDGKLVDHVHNDYVETLAETGILGGLCGLAFLWILFREGRRIFVAEQGHFSRGIHAGAIAALSGILLHSIVDFNLHIPSNALLFLLQAYLATSPPLPTEAGQARRRERVRTGVYGEVAEQA
jgi:O-antigen ligase